MAPSKSIDIEKYLDEHLPYSIRILLTHKKLTENTYQGDPDLLESCFVGSLIKGRMLLEMLGVGHNAKTGAIKKYDHHENDISATDLRGKLIDLSSDLTDQQK